MGKWNRRYYQPRNKFRNYHYDDPPSTPPELYHTNYYLSRGDDNGVPTWEIDYCHSVRVPWRKVLAARNYIHCHPIILNWDDSAGKEALQNAKKRYWAKINSLPYDNPLPDPDIYIAEIDWNPYVDPALMADLDIQVFNPDDIDKLETINEEGGCSQAECDKSHVVGDDPWERDLVRGTESSKDNVQGWSRWGDDLNLNVKNDNPWEQSCRQVDSSKDSAWTSGNGSWGQFKGIDNNGERPRNFGDHEHSCGNGYFTSSKGRGWRDNRVNSWGWRNDRVESSGWRNDTVESSGWRKSNNEGSDPGYRDPQQHTRGGRAPRGGYRKRESSLQHPSKFKRYHNDKYGSNYQL